jgi:SAM-dependent methyltransferase
MKQDTDRDWEILGKRDPYFAVLTQDKFKKKNMADADREEFWVTGEQFIERAFNTVRKSIDSDFSPENALDFGCGVGRLIFPLASRCKHVTGIDVSPSMLKEAAKEAKRRGMENISLLRSGDCVELEVDRYDFIHSRIVFQHIPVDQGYLILDRMLSALQSLGVGILQFTYHNPNRERQVRENAPKQDDKGFIGQMKDKLDHEPVMQMNEYDLNVVFRKIHEAGATQSLVELTDHGVKGITVYFRKT